MSVIWANKLVPGSGTYLISIQGYMFRIVTLEGNSPPRKNRESSCKGDIKWICMARHETSSSYMADSQSQEDGIRPNKEIKTHDNAITT